MTELTVNQVDVARLNVGDDEIVMLTTPGIISRETAHKIKEAFARAFHETGGKVPPILVMDNGLKVEVVRRFDLALQLPQTEQKQ
jgi:hypothetical protein